MRASCATDWVERSGSSIDYVDGLLGLFPRARIVHLVRDGREVALSMRNHAAYRMAVQLLYGVMPDGVDPTDEDALAAALERVAGDPAQADLPLADLGAVHGVVIQKAVPGRRKLTKFYT